MTVIPTPAACGSTLRSGSRIAYHAFSSPLPYNQTLALQDELVRLRLEARKRDPASSLAKTDLLLLLGPS